MICLEIWANCTVNINFMHRYNMYVWKYWCMNDIFPHLSIIQSTFTLHILRIQWWSAQGGISVWDSRLMCWSRNACSVNFIRFLVMECPVAPYFLNTLNNHHGWWRKIRKGIRIKKPIQAVFSTKLEQQQTKIFRAVFPQFLHEGRQQEEMDCCHLAWWKTPVEYWASIDHCI